METLKILLVTMLPLLAGACRSIGCQEKPDPPPPEPLPVVTQDSTLWRSVLRFEGPFPVTRTDIFIYRPDGLKDLTDYLRTEGATAELCLRDSLPRTIAVAANARGTFNTAGLKHFDSLGGIICRLADEDPTAPLMSGIFSFIPGRDTVYSLTPLLCTVELISVTNHFDGDVLAENPRVWLENVNSQAALFKEQGFTVVDPFNSKRVRLPCDIGLYTQYPGIKLYCYPNDLPNPTTGNPATEFVLQCEIAGETRTYRRSLHPLFRGETVLLDVEIHP